MQDVDYDDQEADPTAANVTRIELGAESTQPGYTLSCQWPEGGPSQDFLTSADIQGAIGAHFSMALLR